MIAEADYLALSGIQHYCFCKRQWALIHIEQQWEENRSTAEGRLLHERVHDPDRDEKRGELLISRAMPVASSRLGVRGECDVVEFRHGGAGAILAGRTGLWQPVPIEYKRGRGVAAASDQLQLCAQGMCLEEMLCCAVPMGYLFYGEMRRRTEVVFTDALRAQTEETFTAMRALAARGVTPRVKRHKGCANCSLMDICLPKLTRTPAASAYIASHANEEDVP